MLENINLTGFDTIVIGLTLLLAIKGLFRGFVSEVLGIIGTIGGAFIASRLATDVGNLVAPMLGISDSYLPIAGFVTVLLTVWVATYTLSFSIQQVLDFGGLGELDRILGMVFGGGKVFLFISIVVFALSNVEFAKKKVEEYTSGSITYPWLYTVGNYIISIDWASYKDEAKAVVETADDIANNISDEINSSK
jgi:membrane protein required for colicin V production